MSDNLSEGLYSNTLNQTMHSSTFADRCRKMLPRIVRVRAIFFIATSLTLFLNASAALSEGWLKMMMWLVWGMMTVYSLCSMYVSHNRHPDQGIEGAFPQREPKL